MLPTVPPKLTVTKEPRPLASNEYVPDSEALELTTPLSFTSTAPAEMCPSPSALKLPAMPIGLPFESKPSSTKAYWPFRAFVQTTKTLVTLLLVTVPVFNVGTQVWLGFVG